MSTSHIADQPDYLAVEAEWRKQLTELMVPMTKRVCALTALFQRKGTKMETYEAIYDGTVGLRADMENLKELETSVLDMLREKRDAWNDAVSTRSGRLGELDAQVDEQQRNISAKETQNRGLEDEYQQLKKSLTSLQEEISRAQDSLKITQDAEANLRQDLRNEAESSVSDREQKLTSEMLEWKQQVEKAEKEQQMALKALDDRKNDLTLSNQLSESDKSRNDAETEKLNNARLILQGLADDIAGVTQSNSKLYDLVLLAKSVGDRFTHLKESYAEKDGGLIDSLKHNTEIQRKLNEANREVSSCKEAARSIPAKDSQIRRLQADLDKAETDNKKRHADLTDSLKQNAELKVMLEKAEIKEKQLNTSLSDAQKALASYREAAFSIPAKNSQIQELQAELATMRPEITKIEDRARQKIGNLEGELQRSMKECSKAKGASESLLTELEEARQVQNDQYQQINQLANQTIPQLEGAEEHLMQRVQELTADIEILRQDADRSNAAAERARVMNDAAQLDRNDIIESNRALTAMNDELQTQISALESKNNEIGHLNAQLSEDVSNLRSTCQTKEMTISELKASLSSAATNARNDLTAKDAEVENLSRKLSELQSQSDADAADNTELRADLADKDLQLDRSRQAAEKLRSETTAEISRLNEVLTGKETQIKELTTGSQLLQETAIEHDRLKLELKGRNTQLQNLQAKFDKLQSTDAATIHDLKADSAAKDTRLKGLNTQMKDIQDSTAAEIQQLKNDLTGRDTHLDDLKRQIKNLEESEATANQQVKTITVDKDNQIHRLNTQLENLKVSTAADIEKIKAGTNEKIAEVRRQHEEDNKLLRRDLDISRDASDRKGKEVHDLQQQLEQLRTSAVSVGSKDKEIEDHRRQIEELKETVASKESCIGKVIEKMKSTYNDANQQVETLTADASQKDQKIQSLQYTLQGCRESAENYRKLEDELAKTKKELEASGRSTASGLDALAGERDNLRNEVYELLDELGDARKEIRRLKSAGQARSQDKNARTRSTSRATDSPAEEEDEILDFTPMIDRQEDGERLVNAPRGKKRKSAETESNGPVTARRPANIRPSPTSPTSATWLLANLRDSAYIPDPPLPAAVLQRLRNKIGIWDRSPVDWDRPTGRLRCVENRTQKRGTNWCHGEGYRCGNCSKHDKMCVVVNENGSITLLPSYQTPGSSLVGADSVGYWMG